MAQICSICRHKKRSEIDELLIRLTPLREIAGRFDVSKSSLSRHRVCLNSAPDEIKTALDVTGDLTPLCTVAHQLKVAFDELLAVLNGELPVRDEGTITGQMGNRRLLVELLRNVGSQLDDLAKLRGLCSHPAPRVDERPTIEKAKPRFFRVSARTARIPITLAKRFR